MRSAVRFACFNSPRDSIPARLAAPSPFDAHPFWGPGRGSHVSSVLEAQRAVGFANASVQILQSNRGEPSITQPNRSITLLQVPVTAGDGLGLKPIGRGASAHEIDCRKDCCNTSFCSEPCILKELVWPNP